MTEKQPPQEIAKKASSTALDATMATTAPSETPSVRPSENPSQDFSAAMPTGRRAFRDFDQTIAVPCVVLREEAATDSSSTSRAPEFPGGDSDSRYQLHGEIARGGMGAILKGRDNNLGRELAIKVLLDAHIDKPQIVQRFIEEAQIGGQLQHPGIAPVYELGQFADRRPFFSMKLVKGETLAKLLADRTDSAADPAVDPAVDRSRFIGIFEHVCQTMAYAHSRGVIHRDLKPANIMVGAFGEVQVMDWGLAKVLPAGENAGYGADKDKVNDKSSGASVIQTRRSQVDGGSSAAGGSLGAETQFGCVMGTPAYMPPEQALGEIDQLDERTDVFGLGAILCEILTGKPPYVGPDSTHVFRLASRGKLDECLARLDASGADAELIVVAKRCLAMEPRDRPRDAGEVAQSVSAHLASVESRLRATEVERASAAARAEEALHTAKEHEAAARAERRARRLQMGLAVGVVCVTAIGAVAALWTAVMQTNMKREALAAESRAVAARRSETKERKRAETEVRRSDNMLADMQTERGLEAGRDGRPAAAAVWFANAAALTGHDRARQSANQRRAQSWLGEAMTPVAMLQFPDASSRRMEFQPGGSLALTIDRRSLRIWDWRNEQSLPGCEALANVGDAAWSFDGAKLAVAHGDGVVSIFDARSGELRSQFRNLARAEVVRWSPDGARIALAGLGVQVWSVADEPDFKFDWPHPQPVYGLNFNRAGTRIVTACQDRLARVFALDDAMQPAPLFAPLDHSPRFDQSIATPVFCDDDVKLVTIRLSNNRPGMWDAATGRELAGAWDVSTEVSDRSLAVSRDGRWVAAGGFRGALLLGVDGQCVELPHTNHVEDVEFDPNGQSLLTTCLDGSARLWPLAGLDRGAVSKPAAEPIFIPQMGSFAEVAFASDGSYLAVGAESKVVIWERPQSQPVAGWIEGWHDRDTTPRPSFDGRLVTQGMAHESSGSALAIGETLSVARMVDGQPAGPTIDLEGLFWDSCVCEGSRSVAVLCESKSTPPTGTLSVFDIVAGKPMFPSIALADLPWSVAARPGHPQVAVLCKNGSGLVVDAKTGALKFELRHAGWSGAEPHARIEYSPDGATLVAVSPNNLVFVRDAETGKLRYPPLDPVVQNGPCRTIAFSRDGRLLATAVNGRNMVQVWDLATGEKVGRGLPHPGDFYGLWSVEFSVDGRQILTGHKDGLVRLWDWNSGELIGTPMQHPDEVFAARFTADGRHILSSVRLAEMHVWDAATGKLAIPLLEQTRAGAGCEPLGVAGDRVVITGGNRFVAFDLSILHQPFRDELPVLLTRAELATNRKLQIGELVPLQTVEWNSRWKQVAKSRPAPPADEALAQALAAAMAAASQPAAANDPASLVERNYLLARHGRWSDAADAALSLVEVQPDERLRYTSPATLLVLAGDGDRYRQLCARMVAQFRESPSPEQADSVCKIALLLPEGVDRSQLPVKVLQESLEQNTAPDYLASWGYGCLALAAYREGEFAQAAKWSEKSFEHNARQGQNGALALVVLSMAQHRLGDNAKARQTLAEAATLIPAELATLGQPDYRGPLPVDEDVISADWLVAEILRREAEAVLTSPEESSRLP